MDIKAPFTEEQVKNLNEYQKSDTSHPFTCCGERNPSCKRRLSSGRYEKQQEYLKKDIEWLKQEVRNLNEPYYKVEELVDWQLANILSAIDIPYTDENEGILIASTQGWVCPCGEYKQDWAHDFMANLNTNING